MVVRTWTSPNYRCVIKTGKLLRTLKKSRLSSGALWNCHPRTRPVQHPIPITSPRTVVRRDDLNLLKVAPKEDLGSLLWVAEGDRTVVVLHNEFALRHEVLWFTSKCGPNFREPAHAIAERFRSDAPGCWARTMREVVRPLFAQRW